MNTKALLALAFAFAVAVGCDREAVDPVKRGEYLVNTSGCHDCHTPWKLGPEGPGPDMTRMLSGHSESIGRIPPPRLSDEWPWAGTGTNTAFAGPWGITYTPNLTPDRLTGLGIWTEEMFVTAIRTGRHMGVSRRIMPPMPWTVYRNLNDADLKSIYAYLRSIPPIANQAPPYEEPGETLAAR